jgi:GNAT superfamily N-acetyltransferase
VTGSTEHALGPEHLAGCLALSRAANWNQNEADWRLMLELGRGWGVSLADGTLVASTLVLPYGAFAWISMVLVLPAQRRKGYASRLLRIATAELERRGQLPVLDATPAGREVYRREGFRDTWGFKRFRLEHPAPAQASAEARPIEDWRSLLALDAEAFGGSRERLLRALAGRMPRCALELPGRGFVLARDGREASQIGPLVARDEDGALVLLRAALAAMPPPLYVDAADHAPRLQDWLLAQGFVLQRPFTRMVRGGAAHAPGNETLVYLVAGPELS